jgi:hypothetical protein
VRALVTTSVLLLAVMAGCSSSNSDGAAAADQGSPAAITAIASGTRLRAKLLTAGGVRELAGFHDVARNEDCTFQPAEAGRVRCLPPTLTAFQGGVFSDPACQVPAASAAAATCAADVKYAITFAYDGVCGTAAASELRTVLDAAGPRYANTGAGCVLQPAPQPGQLASVGLGAVVPWTDFVEGVETVVPGSPVAERVLVAADGARAHLGFRDEKLGADCSFQLMSDGFLRCVPQASTGRVYYADAACSNAVLVDDDRNRSGCLPKTGRADTWLEPTNDQCSGLRAVYSLRENAGSAASDETFSWQNEYSSGQVSPTTKCASNGTPGGGGYEPVRRAIAANLTSSLPTVTRVGSGSGRLVPTFVWPAGATSTLVPGWHDTERDVDCTFALASDGKTRCLPVAAKGSVFFTDDACKSTSIVAVPTETSCIGAARFVRTVSTTCPPTTSVYALASEPRDLPSASIVNGPDRCAKVGGVIKAREATLVDPGQFVEAIATVE